MLSWMQVLWIDRQCVKILQSRLARSAAAAAAAAVEPDAAADAATKSLLRALVHRVEGMESKLRCPHYTDALETHCPEHADAAASASSRFFKAWGAG